MVTETLLSRVFGSRDKPRPMPEPTHLQVATGSAAAEASRMAGKALKPCHCHDASTTVQQASSQVFFLGGKVSGEVRPRIDFPVHQVITTPALPQWPHHTNESARFQWRRTYELRTPPSCTFETFSLQRRDACAAASASRAHGNVAR
jgi:hypothetical protein